MTENQPRPNTEALLDHADQLGREGGTVNEAVTVAVHLANEVRRLQRVHRTELKQQSGLLKGRAASWRALYLRKNASYLNLKAKFGKEMVGHDAKVREAALAEAVDFVINFGPVDPASTIFRRELVMRLRQWSKERP